MLLEMFFFGLIEAVLAFVLASLFFQSQPLDVGVSFSMNVYILWSFIFAALGLLLLTTLILGVTRFKMEKTGNFAMLLGFSGVIILFLSGIQLMGIVPRTLERSILNVAMVIAGFGLIINQW